MHVFGLTGGVASGKSVVADRFRRRGVPVIDADVLARQAVVPGSPALSRIVDHFGTGILSHDGVLDRALLAKRVFDDREQLATLNTIVHPEVARLLEARLDELRKQNTELVCYEVPLLFENGLQERLRPVVLVATSPRLQVERAITRSGWTEAQARARIEAQWSLDDKRALADYVIDNDGTLEQTRLRADEVLRAVRARVTGTTA